MSPFVSPRAAAGAAVVALGALALAPSAFAADATLPVPGADVAATAKQFKTSQAEIIKRQLELAPIIKELAPRANQPSVKPRLKVSVVANAKADGCFKTIGENAPTPDAQGNCPAGYKPKFNQGYVYGSTTAGKYMYFGTVGNAACGAAVTFWGNTPPFANDDFACEGAGGPNGRKFGWPAGPGDFARHQVARVDTDTNQLQDLTPTDAQAPLFQYGTGVRGGGAKDGVVLLGTTTFNEAGTGYRGVDLLAYDAETGEFLGEKLMPQYFNIRNGAVLDGHLYFGVRLAGTGSGGGGGVIKWTGSRSDPFQFEVVAQGLKSEPAYITLHEGRIVTAGWTTVRQGGVPTTAMAEMYQSPVIPAGGLTAATADAANWKTLFRMSDLEPDPVIARAMNFGDITSYKGKLLFSTYTYPGYLTGNAFTYYGKPADDVGKLNTMLNAERAISILELDNAGEADQKARLLYGEAKVPVFNTTTKRWERKDNNLHQTPKFGPAGFGNRMNAYSWMWQQYKGSLYMSTFDASSLAQSAMKPLNPALMQVSPLTLALLQPVLDLNHKILGGGDVWRFDDPNLPALPETLNGFGQKTSHGVRGWGAFPERNKLYAGMATWANLKEGWRVNQLQG